MIASAVVLAIATFILLEYSNPWASGGPLLQRPLADWAAAIGGPVGAGEELYVQQLPFDVRLYACVCMGNSTLLAFFETPGMCVGVVQIYTHTHRHHFPSALPCTGLVMGLAWAIPLTLSCIYPCYGEICCKELKDEQIPQEEGGSTRRVNWTVLILAILNWLPVVAWLGFYFNTYFSRAQSPRMIEMLETNLTTP